jgi:hypothetical protein
MIAALAHWLIHHPVWALILVAALYAAYRLLRPAPQGEVVYVQGGTLGSLAAVAAAIAFGVWVMRQKAHPAAAHPVPTPTHTAVVHITKVVPPPGVVNLAGHLFTVWAIVVIAALVVGWSPS